MRWWFFFFSSFAYTITSCIASLFILTFLFLPLASSNPGTFLVRVSENRFGYTLSYRISDRCRHYIVEQDSRGRYALVGVAKVCECMYV